MTPRTCSSFSSSQSSFSILNNENLPLPSASSSCQFQETDRDRKVPEPINWADLPAIEKKKIATYLGGLDVSTISRLDQSCRELANDQKTWLAEQGSTSQAVNARSQANDELSLRQLELAEQMERIAQPNMIYRIGQGATFLLATGMSGAIKITGIAGTLAATCAAGVSLLPLCLIDPYFHASSVGATFAVGISTTMEASTAIAGLICSIPDVNLDPDSQLQPEQSRGTEGDQLEVQADIHPHLTTHPSDFIRA